jgi:hypothetical protein
VVCDTVLRFILIDFIAHITIEKQVFVFKAMKLKMLSNVVAILQNEKLNNTLMKLGDNVEERSLTICSGTDYININYQHVVCPDVETAKVIT